MKRFSKSSTGLLLLALALALAACGDPTATPAPATTGAAATTTKAGGAPLALLVISGTKEVQLDPALSGALAKALPASIGNPSIKVYSSDNDIDKLANDVDTTLTGAGYKFALPGQSKPFKSGSDNISAAYVKPGEADVLVNIEAIPANEADIIKSFDALKLDPAVLQGYVNQVKGKKSTLAIISAPNLLQNIFTPTTLPATTAASTTPATTAPAKTTVAITTAIPATTAPVASTGKLDKLPFLVIGDPSANGATRKPSDGAVDPEGNLYIADEFTQKVSKYDPNGKFKGFVGGPDPAYTDTLYTPRQVVADGSGNIYVNYLNHVYKYDANGKVLGQVGDKKLDHYSIALDKSGNLYAVVTDSTLLKYDSQSNVVAKLQVNQNKKKTDQLQPGEFDYNSFVRVDPAGNIYLFEQYYQKRVQKFSPDMKFVGLLETPKDASGKPSDVVDITFDKDSNPIVVNSKHLWKFDGAGKLVSDTPTDLSYYPKRLIALADGTFFLVGDVARTGKVDQSGKLLQPVGASNRTQPGQFESVDAVVADANGNFYVADGYQNRIQKFDRNGKLLLTIDQKLVGQALSAYYMALDKSGNLYVAGSDRAFGSADRVLKLSPEGKLLATIGKKGDADGQFQSTSGLVLDNKGNLYVGDEKKGVIQKFGPDGAFIEKYAVKEKDTDKLYHMSMAFDSAGNLYVAGIENKGVLILGPEGKTKGFMDNKEVKDASVFSIYIDAKDTRYILTRGGFGTGAVVMLDKDGQLVKKFQGEGSNVFQFKNPSSLTVDAAGNIYVTEWDNARIQRWNPDDTSLKPGDPLPGTK